MQINKLKEQIIYRDELLDEARRIIKVEGLGHELEDDRIVALEDIIYDQPMAGLRGDRDNREHNNSQIRNY
jgi:hypothetical protein